MKIDSDDTLSAVQPNEQLASMPFSDVGARYLLSGEVAGLEDVLAAEHCISWSGRLEANLWLRYREVLEDVARRLRIARAPRGDGRQVLYHAEWLATRHALGGTR